LDLLQKVSRLNPQKIQVYLLESLIQAKRQDNAAAAKALEEGLKANPKALELYLARASLADSQKQFELGEAALLQAIALAPDNARLQTELVRHYVTAGQWDKAEQTLRRNLSLEPDKEAHAKDLAAFLVNRKRPKEAEQVLKDFVKSHPQNYQARFALADYYLSIRRVALAAKILQQIAADDAGGPKGIEARERLAAIRLAQGETEEAEKLVNGVLKDNPKDIAAIRLQGEIALIKKDGLKAVNNFRLLTQDSPKNPEVWLLLARAHRLQGEQELAKEKAVTALQLKPDFLQARAFLYGLFLEKKDYAGALQTIKGYLRSNDKDVYNLTALGEVYILQGDYAQAQEAFQKIVNLDPKKPEGYFRLGLLKREQKQPDQALKYFDQALGRDPDFLPALQQKVAVFLEQKQLDKGVEAVRQELAKSPNNPKIQEMLGELLLIKQQPEAAAAVLEQAVARDPGPQALRLLAAAYLQQPDQNQVMQRLEERTRDPKVPPYTFLILSSLYEKKKEYSKAKDLYETLLTRDLYPALASNNLAYVLVQHSPTAENLERAQKLSAESLEQNPEEPGFLDTMGWVLSKRGQYAKAKTYLEQAAAKAPNNPTMSYHLAYVEAKLNEIGKAQEILKKILSQKNNFPERDEAQKLLDTLAPAKP
jgi:tetratricopeptide (TPR) repeat protein